MTQSSTAVPQSTPSALRGVLADTDGVLVCLDFDGTLTPIADSPTEPLITDENYRAIRKLRTHPQTRVAIISGRALTDLEPRVGVPDIVYAGNHGLELSRAGTTAVHPDAATLEPRIQQLSAALQQQLSAVPGAIVENKGLSVTVHYRQVPAARQPAIRQVVDTVTSPDASQLRIVPGKAAMEIRPAVDWDKGDTVTKLKRESPAGWRTLYIGDDTTDEDAFAVLGPGDLDIFVGSDRTTASYRVADHCEVASLLDWIARSL